MNFQKHKFKKLTKLEKAFIEINPWSFKTRTLRSRKENHNFFF